MLQNGENIFTLQLGFPFRSTHQPEFIWSPPFSILPLVQAHHLCGWLDAGHGWRQPEMWQCSGWNNGCAGPIPEAGMVMRSSLQTMLKSASNCRRPRWKCCSLSSSAHSTPLAVQVPGLSNIMEYFVKSYGTQPGALRVQFTSETLLGALFTSLNPRGLPRTAPMPWPELLLSRGLRRPAPSCAPLRRGISSPSLHHHHPLRGPRRTRRQSR